MYPLHQITHETFDHSKMHNLYEEDLGTVCVEKLQIPRCTRDWDAVISTFSTRSLTKAHIDQPQETQQTPQSWHRKGLGYSEKKSQVDPEKRTGRTGRNHLVLRGMYNN